jgi:cysteinyl-tRNA synthetase
MMSEVGNTKAAGNAPGHAVDWNLVFFNTLTRSKDAFVPIEPGRVRLYCCGPTVYNTAHIGNLRTYIFEDLLVRVLREAGYAVTHVMNITDVGHLQSDADEGEDKMVLAAEREHRSPWDIARGYEETFFADCAALNIKRPDIVSRATEHVTEMIAFIEQLEKNGCAYVIDGNVYFDVSTRPTTNCAAACPTAALPWRASRPTPASGIRRISSCGSRNRSSRDRS